MSPAAAAALHGQHQRQPRWPRGCRFAAASEFPAGLLEPPQTGNSHFDSQPRPAVCLLRSYRDKSPDLAAALANRQFRFKARHGGRGGRRRGWCWARRLGAARGRRYHTMIAALRACGEAAEAPLWLLPLLACPLPAACRMSTTWMRLASAGSCCTAWATRCAPCTTPPTCARCTTGGTEQLRAALQLGTSCERWQGAACAHAHAKAKLALRLPGGALVNARPTWRKLGVRRAAAGNSWSKLALFRTNLSWFCSCAHLLGQQAAEPECGPHCIVGALR